MSKNFLGGIFDFNRDGKTTVFEQAIGLSIIDECSKNGENTENNSSAIQVLNKKKPGKVILVLLTVILLITLFLLAKNIFTYSRYKMAENLIVAENYMKANEILESLDEDYLNIENYMMICNARLSYDKDFLTSAYQYMIQVDLEQLPKDYRDSFLEFKETVAKEYEQYVVYQQQEQIKELKEKAENGVPFVGMPEEYIDQTIIGKSSKKIRHNWEVKGSERFLANLYDFYNEEGKIFTARCVDGTVTHVWDYRDAPVKPYIPQNSGSTVDEEDPYNVSEYSDPEDFYYDHYDDFFDYEDAEDYYNEHVK